MSLSKLKQLNPQEPVLQSLQQSPTSEPSTSPYSRAFNPWTPKIVTPEPVDKETMHMDVSGGAAGVRVILNEEWSGGIQLE